MIPAPSNLPASKAKAPSSQLSSGFFVTLRAGVSSFAIRLKEIKERADVDFLWYRYPILDNIVHIEPLIKEEYDFLFEPGNRYADIGGADGDLAFYLETMGNQCHLYDHGPTNMNNLRGATYLRHVLGSKVEIIDINLDTQFTITKNYDLIFFLGILYHLKNPFYIMEKLSEVSRFMLLSTRIARQFRHDGSDFAEIPAAYLLGPNESNNDATNFWIFTVAGLKRLISRTGWETVDMRSVGDQIHSNPYDADRDERAFALLRSCRRP